MRTDAARRIHIYHRTVLTSDENRCLLCCFFATALPTTVTTRPSCFHIKVQGRNKSRRLTPFVRSPWWMISTRSMLLSNEHWTAWSDSSPSYWLRHAELFSRSMSTSVEQTESRWKRTERERKKPDEQSSLWTEKRKSQTKGDVLFSMRILSSCSSSIEWYNKWQTSIDWSSQLSFFSTGLAMHLAMKTQVNWEASSPSSRLSPSTYGRHFSALPDGSYCMLFKRGYLTRCPSTLPESVSRNTTTFTGRTLSSTKRVAYLLSIAGWM